MRLVEVMGLLSRKAHRHVTLCTAADATEAHPQLARLKDPWFRPSGLLHSRVRISRIKLHGSS